MSIRSPNIESRKDNRQSKTQILKFIRHSLFSIRYLASGAFTLIELLIVIAIIGILASISVVGWVSVAERGRDSSRKSDLARIKQALQQEYSDTRLYPFFDESKGLIYAAGWQLKSNDGLGCAHSTKTHLTLTPKYLAEIPRDPKDSTDYTQACGTGLTERQANRYLYISSPIDQLTNAPAINASGFALMATLETNQANWVLDSLNPLKSASTVFGDWYNKYDNYNHNTIGVTANYLIDSKNQ